jgi:hypothetical protein
MNRDEDAKRASAPSGRAEPERAGSQAESERLGPQAGSQKAVPSLSIVVPAFNEERRLDRGAELFFAALAEGALDARHLELIVVDDGSTDHTEDQAREVFGSLPRHQVIRIPHAGKGAAVRAGVATASAPLVAFMDADMSIHPRQVPQLVQALGGAEVAIASRSLPGSSGDGVSLGRVVMGRAFNGLINAVAHLSLSDTQCGFKAFRTPVARLLFHCSVIDRYAFDVEVLYLARRLGFGITEVPVHWRQIEGSRIRPLRDPAEMLTDVLRRWSGRRAPQPVEGVVVGPTTNGTSNVERARRVVGPTMPVLGWRDGAALVLLPLCRPAEATSLFQRLRTAMPGPLRRVSLTVTQLAEVAPLHVSGPTARKEAAMPEAPEVGARYD